MRFRHMKARGLAAVVVALALGWVLFFAFPASGAEPKEGEIEVMSSEAVILETDHRGTVEKGRIVTFFGLTGEGTVDVSKDVDLEGDGRWQGVHAFTMPRLEGDQLVWHGLRVEGVRNVMSSMEFKGATAEEVRMRIPLRLEYRYYLDGQLVEDPETITGKDGHFRLELTMTNTSKELRRVRYSDPETGDMREEEVEVYLPLVILPYDWYFDNDVFFNLKADPTGVVVPLPDHWQVGWSIPLFPPATEESHTIWVEADVRDFRLPPLVLSVNFTFPQTNQRDTLSEFVAGLEQLFVGVKQLHEGLMEGVEGLGSPGQEDTLLYGTAAILDGLRQMADARSGLPYAKASLDSQLLPGVDQVVQGVGSPSTPDTLLYGVSKATEGLLQMLGGIGGPGIADTLLYAMSAMRDGLGQILAGVGSEGQPDTLLYAVDQASQGLEEMRQGIGDTALPDTLLFAMDQMAAGLEQMKAGIGSPTTPDTLLYAMSAMRGGLEEARAGIGSPTTPDTMLYGLAAVADGLNQILAGLGSETTPDTLLYGINEMSRGLSSGDPANPGILEGIQEIRGGLHEIWVNTSTDGPIYQGLNLIRILAPWTGPIVDQLEQGIILSTDPDNPSIHYGCQLMMEGADQIIAGIGSPTTPDTLLYGAAQIQGGLEEMKAGIGSPTTPDTLLYGVAQVQGGLEMLKAGIGDAGLPDTLLYAVDQVQGGLNLMLQGIGSPDSEDTLLYAVAQVDMGLKLMRAGIGNENTPDTLLYAMSAMNMGLKQIKAGIGSETTSDTLLYAVAQVQNGLELMKAGIGGAEIPDTLLYAMAQVQNGLYQVKNGLSSGDMRSPGIREGLLMISAGLGEAVAGLGSTSTPDTLLYGADRVNSGVEQVKEGLIRATSEGTGVMYAALAENLAVLYLTQGELEAIKERGREFDHILGRVDNAEVNMLTFVYQTPPTYNYRKGSSLSLLVAGILSLLFILAILGFSLILRRFPVAG
ncbi:MAG: hypothetical protein ACUVS1_01495 [Actinomycetota bacterium]